MRTEKPIILVIDDNPQNLQVVGSILVEQGYTPRAVQSGKQALKSLETFVPELILLDVSMPEMNGFETCRQIKAMTVGKDIPIIFLTARTEIDDILEGFDIGAVDYVSKPFNSRELLARIKLHLELKWSKEEINRLESFLPICSFCKKIRDDKGYWDSVEKYISDRTESEFSHSICPECLKEHYPELADELADELD
jgi:DNA-binding response OmpR family regulator